MTISVAAASAGLLPLAGANLWIARSSAGLITSAPEAGPAPVALVLGAGLTPSGEPTPYLAYRLDVAADLYRRGRVEVLLVSGDNRTHDYDEPTAMRDYLIAHEVPAERIVRDFAGRDTYDSCARAQRIFGVEKLIVVSQEYHLPRAVATCRALGLEVQGVGDVRARDYGAAWAGGVRREKLAAVKTVWDLTTGRDPVLGERESGVRDALTAAVQGGVQRSR